MRCCSLPLLQVSCCSRNCCSTTRKTRRCAILENQVLQMQREVVEIQDIYTDMRGLRHDMRSHIANVSLLVKSAVGSVSEELESYIGKMEETVSRLDFTYQTEIRSRILSSIKKGRRRRKNRFHFRLTLLIRQNC